MKICPKYQTKKIGSLYQSSAEGYGKKQKTVLALNQKNPYRLIPCLGTILYGYIMLMLNSGK